MKDVALLQDLINRKDAEIFNLNEEISALKLKNDEFLKSNEKANAEIERFKHIKETVDSFWSELQKLSMLKEKDTPTLEELLDYIEDSKSEAYREFAKYLTKHIKDEFEQCGNPNHDTQPIAYGTVLGLKSALSFVETAPIILESDVPDKTATSVSLIDGHIEE